MVSPQKQKEEAFNANQTTKEELITSGSVINTTLI